MDKAYEYALDVVNGSVNAPIYVKKQCQEYIEIVENKSEKYCLNQKQKEKIENITKLLNVPKGVCAGKTVYEVLVGFQWLFIIAIFCVVHRGNENKRRYETGLLEICRKNGKTFLVGVIFIILFLTEPRFSKFYSVAPDGSLSREIQTQMREIITTSPALENRFKLRRDDILCLLNDNDFVPLSFSTSRLDGKLPNAFVADEVGALPVAYPVEAMRSGQLTINNKLGCIISTKYPTIDNPFEDEVDYAKKVLDRIVEDDTYFSLLYEPDNTKEWQTDDSIIEQGNPLALYVPLIMDDLKKKRQAAIVSPSRRENFLTKHCNIIYQGMGTTTYVSTTDVIKCRSKQPIDWTGRTVYLGVDLSQTTDNTAVSMVTLAEDGKTILAQSMPFVPADRVEEKTHEEKVQYQHFIDVGQCVSCGGPTIDYSVVEEYVFNIEKTYGCNIAYIGFDRANAMSSAQKWDEKYATVEIKQHSSVLHQATKLLKEKIINGEFCYDENRLLEINFQNAKVDLSANMLMYVNKKKSNGKVDMVVSLINAVHLLNTYEILDNMSWGSVTIR